MTSRETPRIAPFRLTAAALCLAIAGPGCGRTAEHVSPGGTPAAVPPAPPSRLPPGPEAPARADSATTASPKSEDLQYQEVVYDKPIDPRYDLRIIATYKSRALTTPGGSTCCTTHLEVSLARHGETLPLYILGSYDDRYEYTFQAERVTPAEVVLCSRGNYGIEAGCTRLFLDLDGRRIVAKIDFNWDNAVDFGDDARGQQALNVTPLGWQALRAQGAFETNSRDRVEDKRELPAIFNAHPLPQSTYPEFAKARPRRVLDGYHPGIGINEKAAGWQPAEGGFWFGKTFYDGEGSSGVGDVGFVTNDGQYRWLGIPEMADWSTLGLLVEPSTIWIGRVGYGEGEVGGAGLLEFDRATKRVRVYDIPEVIHTIVHVEDAVFLGTTHGLHVIRNGVITRYRMEPDLNGVLIVVVDRVR